ncbi:MAG: signal peptidase II, partial [bacterium]|nr:signal peptidase II [bacterium]
HVRNTGAAFGMLANLDAVARIPFFYGVSGIAICVLIYAFLHLEEQDHYYPWPLSLIAGGILGNLIDRIRFGNVVDFLSVHIQESYFGSIKLEWPAFNVADSAITISMILLFAHILKKR